MVKIEDLIWEMQDQIQRGNQMLAELCKRAGIDPVEAARLPGEGTRARQGGMSTRAFTVECGGHGEMERNEAFEGWTCPDPDCGAWLPDSEVRRLVSGTPDSSPDPVPIVVT